MTEKQPSKQPFGTYAPGPWQKTVMSLTTRLPANWLGKRLAFALRRLALPGKKRPFDVQLLNRRLRLYPYDNICEKRVLFTPQMFDADERTALADMARAKPDGFTFLDIGANVGLYSQFVAGLPGENTRIVAVEADPEMYARLCFNISANDDARILALNCAAGAENGTLKLFIDTENRGENSAVIESATGQSIEVPSRTLLDIMDEAGIGTPDALKIDIEGAEYPVLKAFVEAAPKDRLPRMMIIENAPARWEGDLFGILERAGFKTRETTRLNRILVRD